MLRFRRSYRYKTIDTQLLTKQNSLSATIKFFQSLSKMASILISSIIFLYIIGMIKSYSYFLTMGFPFIIDDYNPFLLLSQSISTTTIIIFEVYIGFFAYELLLSKYKNIRKLNNISKHFVWLSMTLTLIFPLLAFLNYPLFLIDILILSIISIYIISYSILLYLKKDNMLTTRILILMIYVTLINIFIIPVRLGEYQAKADKDINQSKLTKVSLNNENNFGTDYRLLLKLSDQYYIIDLKNNYKLRILSQDKIKFLHYSDSNKYKWDIYRF